MEDVLSLFNCIVIERSQRSTQPCLTYAGLGVITNFDPNAAQSLFIEENSTPLNISTLFTREERENAPSIEYLLGKQILHYIEVYGLGTPGLFNLECGGQGNIVVMRFVEGITVIELATKVQDLLYANAPIKDAAQLKRIIEHYNLDYSVNFIQNNEMRVALYRPGVDTFKSGDDAVRYLCYVATGEALLIKSKEVIAAVAKSIVHSQFFCTHENVLAQVFNRHKRLILAAKKTHTATAINRIARKSKTQHVPVRESVAKTFVHRALTGNIFYPDEALDHVSIRNKFKYLNLLAQKKIQSPVASFKIRNGKVWTREDRQVYSMEDILRVESAVIDSLALDLRFFRGQTVLLDKRVDYGLPVSRKQTIGNLPFGTQIVSDSNEISSGIYWENSWGATDLDLSTIDMDGNRVGWGGVSGYSNRDIIFSGDLVDARDGAMEFMTSKSKDYGLFVNIFSGENGSKMELIVGGNRTKKHWIENTIIREKHTLNSRNSVIGFVKGKTFVVYAGRLDSGRVSQVNPIINESKATLWTVQKLFICLGIDYDVDRQEDMVYNHDLSYSSFSFDKLENVFKAT